MQLTEELSLNAEAKNVQELDLAAIIKRHSQKSN
jgi:hypothetical protein